MDCFVRHCILLSLLAVFVKDAYFAPAPEEEENIANGRLARDGEFPFQVVILIDDGSKLSLHCGGAIISESVILTASHCAFEPLPRYLVRAGVNHVFSKAGQDRRVQQIVVHPHFHQSSLIIENDVALLKLWQPLHFNPKVNVINLNSRPVQTGTRCSIIGWGYHEPGSPVSNSILKTGTITTQSQFDRKLIHLSVHRGDDTICKGDSGGPLVCNGVVAGITSYGLTGDLCPKEISQGFTSVDYYYNWIITNMP